MKSHKDEPLAAPPAEGRIKTEVFLSYRRNDSIEQTNKLEETLSREFVGLGVFIDRKAIAPGENFEVSMITRLQESRVVLILIGPDWAGPLPDGSTRIADERDAVRREVEHALLGMETRGQHVVPVLVGGASMPAAATLPESLRMLCKINALPMRSGDDQAGDLDRILTRVRAIVDDPLRPPVRPFLPHNYDGEDERFRVLTTSFYGTHQTLQALLNTCSIQASALRYLAESFLSVASMWQSEHPAMPFLIHDLQTGKSHLDRIMDHDIGSTSTVGSLTGAGNLCAWQGADRQELDMALRLGDAFRATANALKPVAMVGWVYYTSRRRFIHIYPWSHSRAFSYSPKLLEMDFFTQGTTRQNPQRNVFWTAPYEDHYGKGMMVTVAAPVYRGKTFLGTVAIDLGTDLLNDFVASQRLARGSVFVTNSKGVLIAAPGITRSRDTGVRQVAEALPPDLAVRPSEELFGQPGAWLVGEHLLMIQDIADTDWKLVHICDRSSLRIPDPRDRLYREPGR